MVPLRRLLPVTHNRPLELDLLGTAEDVDATCLPPGTRMSSFETELPGYSDAWLGFTSRVFTSCPLASMDDPATPVYRLEA